MIYTKKPKYPTICLICRKIFLIYKYRIRKARFCCHKCYAISLLGSRLSRKTRNKISDFRKKNPVSTIFKKGQQSWNKGKRGLIIGWNKGMVGYLAGSKHYNWKGGISKPYKMGYKTSDYKKWRQSVFERDKYTCQYCGCNNCYITAHHIKSFAYYPRLRFKVGNGLTLCESCHSKTDNYKARAKHKH